MTEEKEATASEIPRFVEAPTVVLHSNSLFAKRAIVLCVGMIVASIVLVVGVWNRLSAGPNGQTYLAIALLPTVLLAIMMIVSFRASRERKPILILTPKGLISSYNNLGTVPWDRVRYLRISDDSLFPEVRIALTESALKERPGDDAASKAQRNSGHALSLGLGQISGTRTEILEEMKPYLIAFGNEEGRQTR